MAYQTKLALASAIALIVTSCGGSSGESATTTTATQATTTTAPATTTAAPATTTTTTTAAPTTTTTTTGAPTTATAPPLPEGLIPEHGGDAVAVYLGVVEYDAVEGNPADGFVDAIGAAEAMGYFVGSGDLACDQGGQEALGFPADANYWAASVLFATVDEANLFVAAFPEDIVGIAEVNTYCLD